MKAFSSISPIDDEYRAELRHGQLMQLLDAANFQRNEKLRPVDFMNFVDRPEEKPLTPEQQESELARIFGA